MERSSDCSNVKFCVFNISFDFRNMIARFARAQTSLLLLVSFRRFAPTLLTGVLTDGSLALTKQIVLMSYEICVLIVTKKYSVSGSK